MGPNNTIQLTPQEIEAWRMEQYLARLERDREFRVAADLRRSVSVLVGPERCPAKTGYDDLAVIGCGSGRQRKRMLKNY
ncbi:MAG: hypothetical protein IPK15_24200 [Verrucomicrobia bacterium]|nr:hypothetical protein [Verrucomicrobiota bacterium]